MLHGTALALRGAQVGTRFRVANAPWDAGDVAPDGFLWTRLTEVGINNLPVELASAARVLGDASLAPAELAALWQKAKTTGYAQRFEAQDQAMPWRPAQADEQGLRYNPKPTAPGVQTAIVVGPDGETRSGASGPVHTDALGRIKVRFHWMQAGASCWLRCVQRYAGQGHGSHFLPRIGQEVLVNFMDGDIDKPVITGSLYNGEGEANTDAYSQAADFRYSAQGNLTGGNSPAWHGQSAAADGHNNAAALSGIKTQGFDGSGSNQLVFDDSDNQGRVQMASSHSYSQLNLGHLIHQADNYRGSFRGTGLELRTDAYGRIKGSRGVLLTTYALPTDNPYADATAVGALMQQHTQLAGSLSGAATTHNTVPLAGYQGTSGEQQSQLNPHAAPLQALHASAVDTVTADDYHQAAKGAGVPHSDAALTTLAGRAGIGALAGDSVQLAADESVNLGSGEHTNLGVGGQLRLHGNQALGILGGAQSADGDGLTAIASKGSIDIQAQHSSLSLQSQQDLTLGSASGNLTLGAKQKIHLATKQGAFITIEGGNVTIGGPGNLDIKAGAHQFAAGVSLQASMNSWPDSNFSLLHNEKYQLVDAEGSPVANHNYVLTRKDGSVIHGVTDADGMIPLQKGEGIEEVQIELQGPAA